MAKREQIQRSSSRREEETETEETTSSEPSPLLDDGILDEIDAVLEENAEEFLESYVQKGGE
jgi:ubiquitin-like protein Pup